MVVMSFIITTEDIGASGTGDVQNIRLRPEEDSALGE